MKTYLETFDHGPGGWCGWDGNEKGFRRIEVKNGAAITRSPWWIDYNHAPPGAGYLHMLFFLNTKGPFGEHLKEIGGPNGFVASGCSRDFTNARVTVRVRGELLERGAKPLLLVQAAGGDIISGWLRTGQPIEVTPEWSEQTLTCVPDESQWTCLGSRYDRADFYGRLPLATVLSNVNVNIMFVLFPLMIRPMGPLEGEPHLLRPERDYPVWRSSLPEGYIMLDTIRVESSGHQADVRG